MADVAVADRVHLGQFDLVGRFCFLYAVVALIHDGGVAGGYVGLDVVVGRDVGALVADVLAVSLLLLLHLLRLLLLHLFGQPQGHRLGHLPHLLLPVVQTPQETYVPHPVLYPLAVLVNKVESSYLLLLARQPA